MEKFFYYNWQVRDEWFEWCKQLSFEELKKKRVGGLGSIFQTLLHIVDVEATWIYEVMGKTLAYHDEDIQSLDELIKLSDELREDIMQCLVHNRTLDPQRVIVDEEHQESFTYDTIVHHVITHEIHHIGQLSIWAREIGLQPVNPNYIRRTFPEVN